MDKNPDIDLQHFIPSKKAAPDVGTLPKHFGKINNLAGDKELCDKVWGLVKKEYSHYDDQEQRTKFMTGGGSSGSVGTMDLADRMYRAALRRNTANTQYQKTISDVVSTMFFVQIRAITASMNQILFGGEELPARYEPELNTDEYTAEQGKDIADQQNLLEQYTWDEDKRIQKIKELILFTNKYGQSFVGIEWKRCVEKKVVNEPTKFDDNGMPISFSHKEKEVVTADYPSLMRYDMKDVWFDAQIDDMQLQRCYIIHSQVAWEELAGEQAQGFIMNVSDISGGQLYREEPADDVLNDRWKNDGSQADEEETGLLARWNAWIMLPIKEKDGKGVLSLDVPAQRYWATFIGDINGDAVCIRLIRNPYFHCKVPHRLIHSHEDDNGCYHLSYASLLESYYWQATTNINQAIDNITLRTRAPWITDGPVHTRDLTFKANKLIRTARGVRFETVAIPDTTNITIAMHDRIEAEANKTTGADDPIQGQALGARTSATEAQNVFDQAMKPIVNSLSYISDQLFPWMLEMDAELWRQYGDPKTVLTVTHMNMLREIKPTELWGPIKTKVTAITQFKNNVIARRDMNQFIQNVYPLFKDIMGQTGSRVLARKALRIAGFDDVNEIIPESGDFDARRVAMDENNNMLYKGMLDEALVDENHEAHLPVHEMAERQYSLLPKDDVDQNALRRLRLHIQEHKDFRSQGAVGASGQPQQQHQPQQQSQVGGMPSDLQGEVLGDQLEAMGGAIG